MVVPFLGWDFRTSFAHLRKGSTILRDATGLELKGSLHPSKMPDGTPVLLFLGTPRLDTLQDFQVIPPEQLCMLTTSAPRSAPWACITCGILIQIQAHNMFIVDVPPHDMAAEFVVLAERRRIQEEMAKKLEADRKQLQEATQLLQQQNAEAELANLK